MKHEVFLNKLAKFNSIFSSVFFCIGMHTCVLSLLPPPPSPSLPPSPPPHGMLRSKLGFFSLFSTLLACLFVWQSVLVKVTIVVMKHNDQSSLGREGFVLDFHISVVRTGTKQSSRAGTLELRQKQWRCCSLQLTHLVFLQNPKPLVQG